MGEAERGEAAPREYVSYFCANHHVIRPAFAAEAEIPDALKAMIDETRAAKVSRAARASQPLALPANTWREVQQRADTIGVAAQLVDEGREVILVLPGR